jgi:anti-sigma factor RsiW
MSQGSRCRVDLGELAAYRLGELAEPAEQALEEHYFGCSECAERLAWLDSLAVSLLDVVRAGRVSSNVSAAWVSQARDQGVRLRSYELGPGQAVECTVSPDDDFVILRLRMDASIAGPVDVETEWTDLDAGRTNQNDLNGMFVDPVTHELLYAFSADLVRTYPRSRWVMQVRPRGAQSAFGPFTLNHTPWQGA